MLNLASLQQLGGQSVQAGDLLELNKALQANSLIKAEGVGYPQQGVGFSSSGGSELAPLVPQSIQQTLDSSTYTQAHIQFWKDLNKQNVPSTLHETNVTREHGNMHLDPFFSEGDVSAKSEALYERLVVKVKYLAEHIELTDVATMVGITGVNRRALAQRTQNGTLALLGKLEYALFNASEQFSPLHFNGLYEQCVQPAGANQVPTADNYTDLAGSVITPANLQEIIGKLKSSPNYGYPTAIYVDPRTFQTLANAASAGARYNQMQAARMDGAVVTFGHKQLFMGGSMGNVEIKEAPLLQNRQDFNTSQQGSGPPPTPAGVTFAVAADPANSKFNDPDGVGPLTDAGDYFYKIVAVGDGGASAPASIGPVSVTTGDSVEFTIPDSGVSGAGDGNVRYYRVYRTAPDGAQGTEKYMWSYATNEDGGSNETVFKDLNCHRPNTGMAYIVQNTPDVLQWVQLLDFTRRPLAQVKTTIPFLLMLFGALHVKQPSKIWTVENISFDIA